MNFKNKKGIKNIYEIVSEPSPLYILFSIYANV